MRLTGLLFIGILIASCTSDYQNNRNVYIENEVTRLNDRINFIESSLREIINKEPSSIRNNILFDQAKLFNEIFNRIDLKLKNDESINDELEEVNESIIMISHRMHMTNNDIDNFIQRKFGFHLTELTMLNITASKFNNDIELTHSLMRIQEGFLSTFFTLSRTDKYTFEKAEPFAFPINSKGSRVSENDSLKVFIGHFAYDSIRMPKIVYWIDDTLLNESNALESNWHYIWVGGNKGKHTVRGKIQNFPNNREDYSYWEFDYIVE